jgi:predicted transglutaminase-like cysteine proteinase
MIIPIFFRKYFHVSLLILLTLLPIAYAYDKGVLDKIIEAAANDYGKKAVERLKSWCKMMETNMDKEESQKLTAVNDFVNSLERESDMDNYGQEDYWATPLELLGRNCGDCEDFSIAKYFSLTMMGVPVEKLRISYVTALELQEAHIVLAYYKTPGSEPLILDILKPEIFLASLRPDLKPIYSFNGEFIWMSKGEEKELKVGMPKMIGRFEKWGDLQSKMQHEISLRE